MSLINTRIHSNTACHAFLSRSIANFEAACNRVAKIVHAKAPSAPLPSVHDAVAQCLDGDSALTSEFMSPNTNEAFVREVADVVASTFTRDKQDFEPDQRAIAKVVGTRLGGAAYPALSCADKVAIVRALDRDAAKALCERRLATRKNHLQHSVATL